MLTSFASVLEVHLQTEELTYDPEERWTEVPQEDVEEDAWLATAFLQRGPGEIDEEKTGVGCPAAVQLKNYPSNVNIPKLRLEIGDNARHCQHPTAEYDW